MGRRCLFLDTHRFYRKRKLHVAVEVYHCKISSSINRFHIKLWIDALIHYRMPKLTIISNEVKVIMENWTLWTRWTVTHRRSCTEWALSHQLLSDDSEHGEYDANICCSSLPLPPIECIRKFDRSTDRPNISCWKCWTIWAFPTQRTPSERKSSAVKLILLNINLLHPLCWTECDFAFFWSWRRYNSSTKRFPLEKSEMNCVQFNFNLLHTIIP